MAVDFQEMAEAIIWGKRDRAEELTRQALEEGFGPKEILDRGLIPGMDVVGEKFRTMEFFVPEVLIAARAMKACMAILRPLLTARNIPSIATVVMGTVRADQHDIGKNLVCMMLEGAGFDIVDLGVQVHADKFVAAVQKHNARLVGMSALLTTTMPYMKDTIQAFKVAGLRDHIGIMVGGAPVTQEFADEIGADVYAPDAATAVDKAKELIKRFV
jgi:5-methyltetrahydrofolate--homocysteine methyltransferase